MNTVLQASPSGDQSDFDLLNQDRSRGRRQADEAEPTAATASADRCTFPQTDKDQLIYIYEFFQSLWYLNKDLQAMTSAHGY